jgi:hypothetical protein
MTPASRFPNTGVPESMRYVISEVVLKDQVTASKSDFDSMDAEREAQGRK